MLAIVSEKKEGVGGGSKNNTRREVRKRGLEKVQDVNR